MSLKWRILEAAVVSTPIGTALGGNASALSAKVVNLSLVLTDECLALAEPSDYMSIAVHYTCEDDIAARVGVRDIEVVEYHKLSVGSMSLIILEKF